MDATEKDCKVEHSTDNSLTGVEAKVETMDIHNEEKQDVSQKGEVDSEGIQNEIDKGTEGNLVTDEKPKGVNMIEKNKPQEERIQAKSGVPKEAQVMTEISRVVGLQAAKEDTVNANEKNRPEAKSQISKETVSRHGNTSISKAVGLDDVEEGELDYEEEEIHDPVVQREDQEEGEMLEEKELEADKEAEGSEEGEIMSDDDDDAKAATARDDKEEGEINDDDLEEGQLDEELDRGPRPRILCKYYEAGTCRWGATCRFLHPGINDKGNYVMHRPVGMYPTAFGKPPPPSELGPLNDLVQRGPSAFPLQTASPFMEPAQFPFEVEMTSPSMPKKETAWERGLKKAKEIKQTSAKRREEDEHFEEKRLNMSIRETELETERPVPVPRRDAWRMAHERENQIPPRPRPVDVRPDLGDRRFNRSRKTPPKRYEPERERRPHFEREKPHGMDRERYMRMRKERTSTSPDRKPRDRDRGHEREKSDPKRDKRVDPRTEKSKAPVDSKKKDVTPSDQKAKAEPVKEAGKEGKTDEELEGAEPKKEDVTASTPADAEQWQDPWMRTQPIQNQSPERKSPSKKSSNADGLSSIGSSDSESESDSEDSDDSGSESGSDSKGSSDENEKETTEKEKTTESASVEKEATAAKSTSSTLKDPRISSLSSKDNTPKRDSPHSHKGSTRSSGKSHHSRSHRDGRHGDSKRHHHHRHSPGRSHGGSDRRHRDRRERFPPTIIPSHPWSGPPHFEAGWSRGPFHEHVGSSYRGIGDRPRRPEDDPRLKIDRPRSSTATHSRKPGSSGHHSSSSKTDKDRSKTSDRRPHSSSKTSHKDSHRSESDRRKKRDDERRDKGGSETGRNAQTKDSSKKPNKPVEAPSEEQTKKVSVTAENIHSDVSEDEFKSPKYEGTGSGSDSDSESGSGSGSESESDGGSESGSESGSGSGSGSASGSGSGSGSDRSGSESEDDKSGSDSDSHSASSASDASTSRKKEIEKKKKDFKMVLSQTKNLSSAQKGVKSQSSTNGSPDPRSLIGQKRQGSGQGSSNSSPKTGTGKTSARKDELLKELKAVEDAIARKRAKVD